MTIDEATLLRTAADHIDSHGWVKGWQNTTNACCAVKAIVVASGDPYYYRRRVSGALKALADSLSLPAGPLPHAWYLGQWNDAQPDAGTVTAALRSAADHAGAVA